MSDSTRKKQLRTFLIYSFGFVLLTRLVTSGFLFYQYIIEISDKQYNKGGTIVEALFEPISFLPYTNKKSTNEFYKRALFNGCVKTTILSGVVKFENDLCKVSTEDYKTYIVTIEPTMYRTDKVPVTLNDVKFTYSKILKDNIRKIPDHAGFSRIEFSDLSDGRLKVTFPNATIDNIVFFTNYILPEHLLTKQTFDYYINTYGVNPVHTNCGEIQPQKNDINSLVFDLGKCSWSNIQFYQLKSFPSFSNFNDIVNEQKGTFIDTYTHSQSLTGFITKNMISDQYLFLFFNTSSPKITNGLKKSFGNLVSYFLYTGDFNSVLSKEHNVFDMLRSDGTSLEDAIKSYDPNFQMNKRDFDNIDIKKLPSEIAIKGTRNKSSYYIDKLTETINLRLQLDLTFDQISISHNGGKPFIPKTYDKKKNVTFYNIGENQNNIVRGLNKYVIKGTLKDKEYDLLDINLYYLEAPEVSTGKVSADKKIKIIYQKDPSSFFVVNRLIEIITERGLQDYFSFIGFNYTDELEGRLLSKDYDIAIRSINLGVNKDLSALLLTDQPTINPSLYKNPALALLINQFHYSDPKSQSVIKPQILDMYFKDFPFIVLGRIINQFQIKKGLGEQIKQQLYENNYKETLVKNIYLTETIDLNRKKIFNLSNIIGFFTLALQKNTPGQ